MAYNSQQSKVQTNKHTFVHITNFPFLNHCAMYTVIIKILPKSDPPIWITDNFQNNTALAEDPWMAASFKKVASINLQWRLTGLQTRELDQLDHQGQNIGIIKLFIPL